MELTYGGRVTAAPHKHGVRARQTSMVHVFWIMLEGSPRALPLTVFLSDGKEALALFSGEEEARMFCHFCEEGRARTSGRPPRAKSFHCCTPPGVRQSTWPSTPSPRSWAADSWSC